VNRLNEVPVFITQSDKDNIEKYLERNIKAIEMAKDLRRMNLHNFDKLKNYNKLKNDEKAENENGSLCLNKDGEPCKVVGYSIHTKNLVIVEYLITAKLSYLHLNEIRFLDSNITYVKYQDKIWEVDDVKNNNYYILRSLDDKYVAALISECKDINSTTKFR
jgi:hypothetical protein